MSNRLVLMRAMLVVVLLVASTHCARTANDEGHGEMTFFVTSVQGGDGGNIGGLAAADAHCQKLAEQAGSRGRQWRAYLSVAATDQHEAVNARDRIGNGPWHNARGVLIANNVADLHGDGNHINMQTARNEKGEVVRGPHDMLTGSKSDGTVADGDATCRNWTSTSGHAMLGHHDRNGPYAASRSWNAAHLSDGCTLPLLQQSGGAALYYCFAAR